MLILFASLKSFHFSSQFLYLELETLLNSLVDHLVMLQYCWKPHLVSFQHSNADNHRAKYLQTVPTLTQRQCPHAYITCTSAASAKGSKSLSSRQKEQPNVGKTQHCWPIGPVSEPSKNCYHFNSHDKPAPWFRTTLQCLTKRSTPNSKLHIILNKTVEFFAKLDLSLFCSQKEQMIIIHHSTPTFSQPTDLVSIICYWCHPTHL